MVLRNYDNTLEIEWKFRICKVFPRIKSYQMDKSVSSTYDIIFREQSLGILFVSGPESKGAIVDGHKQQFGVDRGAT